MASSSRQSSERFEKSIEDYFNNEKRVEYLDLETGKFKLKESIDGKAIYCASSLLDSYHVFHSKDKQLNTVSDLALLSVNNIGCLREQINLLSKVSLKHFYKISARIEELEAFQKSEYQLLKAQLKQIQKQVEALQDQVFKQQPLTKKEITDLVAEIAEQPKLVEKEALKLTEDLNRKLEEVKALVTQVKHAIGY